MPRNLWIHRKEFSFRSIVNRLNILPYSLQPQNNGLTYCLKLADYDRFKRRVHLSVYYLTELAVMMSEYEQDRHFDQKDSAMRHAIHT